MYFDVNLEDFILAAVVLLLSHVQLSATPGSVSCQTPLSPRSPRVPPYLQEVAQIHVH